MIKQEEALPVRKIFSTYALDKDGASAICKKLNDSGIRNRNGCKWGRRVVLYMLKNPVYIGKIRWRDVQYEGQHDPVVSDILFKKAREVLDERNEELKGRQFHNGDERLLTGIIKCARCKSHMFGGGGQKGGRYIPYYVCSKRLNKHECKQDYVRAELLEAAIVKDIKSMFRDEEFMARVWAEANKWLGAEKPDIEKEIGRIETEATKVRVPIDRYFGAFEAGTLKAELCNRKVQDLQGHLDQLDAEKSELEARRERLKLRAIDREMLAKLVDNFEQVIADGPNAQEKRPPAPVGEEDSDSRPSDHRNLVRVTKRAGVRTLEQEPPRKQPFSNVG
ncbi:MAG TPA: recombinase family protein [Phycisphaerae bacterium]|nr:recombinase family protein [Phycisphaerae bacterium]